jgi:hypothetical protein
VVKAAVMKAAALEGPVAPILVARKVRLPTQHLLTQVLKKADMKLIFRPAPPPIQVPKKVGMKLIYPPLLKTLALPILVRQ